RFGTRLPPSLPIAAQVRGDGPLLSTSWERKVLGALAEILSSPEGEEGPFARQREWEGRAGGREKAAARAAPRPSTEPAPARALTPSRRAAKDRAFSICPRGEATR